ncbi:tyrosine-type recombinase/integrase [Devosia sp. Root635]|uniref:tyrosine-type recombinase/integrase n=1 Tax=Devosia sp. Root635 TaxID=1736575 RepID=UPI0006FE5B77|nr:site-specific integrase [Devosia sp. Root635]KRA42048.1 integrase [Devosia sp. Root635]
MSVRKRTWTSKGVEKTAWVVDYIDSQDRRRLKTFKLKKDADQFAATATIEVREGVHVADAASATVLQAGRLWIAAKDRAGRERSTIDQYRQHLELHIAPFIGTTRLNALTLPALRQFEERLLDEGRSPAMVRKVVVSLGSLIADAQERGLVARNVVREMRGRRGSSDRRAEKRAKGRLRVGVDIPAPGEVKAIVGALRGRWRPVLLTAIFTGLRASELRGLRWADVDLDRKVLHVRQRADRFNDIGQPKSEAGEREVPLPPIVVNTLREWRLICPRRDTGRKDGQGEPIKELDLVFPNGRGKVESLANMINRGLLPVQVRAGVTVETGGIDPEGQPILAARYTGMHALRHFYASWCINRPQDGGLGLPPKVVQERLGHATINLTMDTYSHLFPRGEDQDELAAAEGRLLS